MTDVRVPTLGESVTEATVATWFKQPGDNISMDEMLCELETDKVTVNILSSVRKLKAFSKEDWFFDMEVAELKFRKINDEAIPITIRTTNISISVKPLDCSLHPIADVCVITRATLHSVCS